MVSEIILKMDTADKCIEIRRYLRETDKIHSTYRLILFWTVA